MTYADILNAGTATPEQFVRAFAQEHNTPNVRRALALCETGALAWDRVAVLFGESLSAALAGVR